MQVVRPLPRVRAALGMNLSGPADWNSELPFVDVFRLSREWISQREGAGWGQGPALDLDANGWVKRLEPGCYAETLMNTIDPGPDGRPRYPGGTYTVLYDGDGDLRFWNAARVVRSEPGRIQIEVDPSRGAIFLQIRRTNPNNHVRNIRVIMPGFESSYLKNPFHPKFLQRWSGIACLRFMDWGETNNSRIERWTDRPTLQTATWTARGVPMEVMCDLCNRLQCDAWICIPHRADDDYAERAARLVREKLNPRLRVWLEYSNELWNGIFSQHRYASERGRELNLGGSGADWEYAWRYTAYRSVQIFNIWRPLLGNRVIRVLPVWFANAWVSERIVEFQQAYRSADVMAIAPYLGTTFTPDSNPSADEVSRWTVEQALDYLENNDLPQCVQLLREQSALARKYNLRLVAYEGGTHFLGAGGAENNERLTQLIMATNRHPRIASIYRRYYRAWEEQGGWLFNYFASTSTWSKWGCWGILEYMDQDPREAPKYVATVEWARRLGQKMQVV